jgi:ribosomal protein S18 acetylase RimI-like enzyme
MNVRPVSPLDREALILLLQQTENFTQEERDVALELIDESIQHQDPSGYRCLVATETTEGTERLLGYICFGRTPMTEHTYDLYWIVVDSSRRRGGVGQQLLEGMETTMRTEGGRHIRVETSSQESYGSTQRFYERVGFHVAGTLPGFYTDDDDLVIYYKSLAPLDL